MDNKIEKKKTMCMSIARQEILNEDISNMFYMASYNLDRFREFVFESKSLQVFDIEPEVIEKIKNDDLELLKLGLKWLKFGLIDRNALKRYWRPRKRINHISRDI